MRTKWLVMKWPLTKWRVFVALLLVLTLLPAVPAQAQGGDVFLPLVGNGQSGAGAVSVAGEADAAATMAFWTREARAAAAPMETEAAPAAGSAGGAEAAGPTGSPGRTAGGLPAPDADAVAQRQFPAEWAAADEAAQAAVADEVDGTAGVFTTYDGNLYTQFWQYYPYRAVGRLYFRTWTGYSRWCNASVISPNNIVVTAAHCLYDTTANRWHGSFLFVPAERNLARPYGSFPYSSARVLPGYVSAASYGAGLRYDVGLLSLGLNSAGHSVSYYTGWLGRSWDWGYVQNQTEIAHASNWRTALYTAISHSESFYWSSDIVSYGSNLAGADGAPLLRFFRPYTLSGNYVNGVQSGSDVLPTPTRNYHARFTTSTIVYLCNLQGC